MTIVGVVSDEEPITTLPSRAEVSSAARGAEESAGSVAQ
jgi:hypothetical protein